MSLVTKCVAIAALALGCVTASANDAPVVSIHIGGNGSFIRQNEPMRYLVVVSDTEEGDTLAGTVDPASVAVEFQYLQAGVDGFIPQPAEAGLVLGATRGRELIENDDCLLCHVERATGRTAVPTFAAIAEKFQGNLAVAPALAVNIQNGTQGIWGTMLMPAHAMTTPQATAMSYYILSFAGDGNTREFLRTAGDVSVDLDPYLVRGPFGAAMPGRYVLSASYTDKGSAGEASATGYAYHALRYPNVLAAELEAEQGFELETQDGFEVLVPGAADAVARLERVDLTGIATIALATAGSARRWPGGTVELRLGAPDGQRAGTFVVAHDERRLAVGQSVVRVGGLEGVHDLYFVVPEAESVAIGAVCFDCSP
jgi:cytochrome c